MKRLLVHNRNVKFHHDMHIIDANQYPIAHKFRGWKNLNNSIENLNGMVPSNYDLSQAVHNHDYFPSCQGML